MSDIEQECETNSTGYGTSEILEKTGVTTRQLYYWESLGLLNPEFQRFGKRQFRRFRQKDLERLLEIKAWLDFGYSLEAVRKMQEGNE